LIQLQNGAFLYNWRKQDGDYPRFNRILVEFLQHLQTFEGFFKDDLKIDLPAFSSAELTYVNLFGTLESLAEPVDYRRVVETFSEHSKIDQNLTLENFHHVDFFRLPNGDQLVETQRSGRQPSDGTPVFVLELKVVGSKFASLADWFSNAHNSINESFVSLTSSKMRTDVWRRK
jgi:uncharacterized protein (TIGR04255 family)